MDKEPATPLVADDKTTLSFRTSSDLAKRADGPEEALSSVSHIDLTGSDVADLTPIQKFRGLISLNLNGCEAVTDLAPLAGMGSLKWLDLSGCKGLTSLAPLKGMKSLQYLDLAGTPFAAVSLADAIEGNVPPLVKAEEAEQGQGATMPFSLGEGKSHAPQGQGTMIRPTVPQQVENSNAVPFALWEDFKTGSAQKAAKTLEKDQKKAIEKERQQGMGR